MGISDWSSDVGSSDLVFHLAGTSSPASAEASRSRDLVTSIGGTLDLLDICRQSRIPSVIFASSGGTVYGAGESPPFSEQTLPRPVSTYGINKDRKSGVEGKSVSVRLDLGGCRS